MRLYWSGLVHTYIDIQFSDGNIRFYEMVDEQPFVFYLSEHKSADPQRGLAFMPKRYLNVSECEIARVYKVHTDRVEPISFKVPRKVCRSFSVLYSSVSGSLITVYFLHTCCSRSTSRRTSTRTPSATSRP